MLTYIHRPKSCAWDMVSLATCYVSYLRRSINIMMTDIKISLGLGVFLSPSTIPKYVSANECSVVF